MKYWLSLGLFALLSLQATWFAALAGLVGFANLLRVRKVGFVGPFVGFALLGGLGQWFSSESFVPRSVAPGYVALSTTSKPSNPISPLLYELSGWNYEDGNRRAVKPADQGFWRIPRYDPQTGREYREFLTGRWYTLEPGRTYTQSFYLRHDGSEAKIAITFFTNRGHNLESTQMEFVTAGVWRVWASYKAQAEDNAVRAIDFISNGGDFTYLDVGWPQLEEGSSPSAYRPGDVGLKSLVWRIQWWAGTALMGFLVLWAGVTLFESFPFNRIALALWLGLFFHLGLALWQWLAGGMDARVTGLTPQPNLLGHGAVAIAGLIWVIGGNRLGGLALLLAALMVWLSGSRTAFWGLLLLAGAWGWSLGSRRWLAFGLAFGLVGLLIWQPELLGRLSQALVFDSNAQARFQFWQAAVQAFQTYPLGGIGLGHFTLYFDLHPPASVIEYAPGHAHSIFLHLLAEGGLLALLGFMTWVLGSSPVLWRTRAWPTVVLLVVVLVMNSFDFTFFSAWVYYPLILAMAVALFKDTKPKLSARMPR